MKLSQQDVEERALRCECMLYMLTCIADCASIVDAGYLALYAQYALDDCRALERAYAEKSEDTSTSPS